MDYAVPYGVDYAVAYAVASEGASATPVQRFKVVVSGDGGVGKTAFINRHLSGTFTPNYVATLGADVHRVSVQTSYGEVVFDMWDTAGQERLGGLADGYYINAKAAIIMFDMGNMLSRRNLKKWIEMYERVSPGTPISICGTKIDAVGMRAVSTSNILSGLSGKCESMVCELSAKNNTNCRAPLLWLARKLTGHMDLELV